MARKTKSSPVLPGQSRSAVCPKGKGTCHRLVGHKGACRATLTQAQSAKPTGPTIVLSRKVSAEGRTWLVEVWSDGSTKSSEIVEERRYSTEGGVEVWTADRYTVQEAKPRAKAPKARQARRPKVQQCRIVKAGVRCSRAYGHKQAGTRHSFAGAVRVVAPAAEPSRVQVVRGKSSRRHNFVASGKPSSRLA